MSIHTAVVIKSVEVTVPVKGGFIVNSTTCEIHSILAYCIEQKISKIISIEAISSILNTR